jgi:hypothetical protein
MGASRVFPTRGEPFFNFGKHLFRWNSRMRIPAQFFGMPFQLGDLLRC